MNKVHKKVKYKKVLQYVWLVLYVYLTSFCKNVFNIVHTKATEH